MFDNEHLKRNINSIVYRRLRAQRIKLHILANYLTLFLSCFIQPQQNTIVIIKIKIIIMHYQISKPRIKRHAIGFKILRTYYIVNNSILDYDI